MVFLLLLLVFVVCCTLLYSILNNDYYSNSNYGKLLSILSAQLYSNLLVALCRKPSTMNTLINKLFNVKSV